MRNTLLMIFELFPFVMNSVSVAAGVLLFFALRLQRERKKNAVHTTDHQ